MSEGMIVSEGTLKAEDLVPRLLSAFMECAPSAFAMFVSKHSDIFAQLPYPDGDERWHTDVMREFMDELYDALDENAPQGTFFGTHEGDPACFGFFPIGEYSFEQEE